MTDPDLLVFGCAVSFIALAGMYVFLREHYVEQQPRQVPESHPHAARETPPGS